MAASQTTRLAIYTWTAGTDTFTRDQMTTSHSNIEARVSGFNQDGSRPTAGAAYKGFFHYTSTDSSAGTLSYCNGTAWFNIGSLSSSTPTSLDGSGSAGSAIDGSRSDHKHAIDNDAITNAMIADNAVQAAQLNADAVTTAKILNSNVTHEKIEDSAALSVIGRSANSSGVVADIAAGTDAHVLRRSGTSIGFGTIATDGIADDAVTQAKIADDAVGADQLASSAVVTASIVDANVTTAKIADDNVTHEKIETSAALSVLGVTGNSTAHVADIAAGTDGHVLRRSGTAVAFGEIATDGIADDAVTNAKVADDAIQAAQLATDSVGNDALDLDGISVYGPSATAAAGYKVYISTSDPSGGDNGDIWLKYTA